MPTINDHNHPLTQCTFIFVGNPDRGDDAVAPMLYNQLTAWLTTCSEKKHESYILSDVQYKLINCFQLEPELCCDIEHSKMVIIVDASIIDSHQPKIEIIYQKNSNHKVDQAALSNHLWSHSMAPQALLLLFEKVYQTPPPTTYLLHIPGLSFSLGDTLSETANRHKDSCFNFLKQCCLQANDTNLPSLLPFLPRPE